MNDESPPIKPFDALAALIVLVILAALGSLLRSGSTLGGRSEIAIERAEARAEMDRIRSGIAYRARLAAVDRGEP